jgi:hypothetical protein
MRTGRAIVIPAILALSAAGSILAGSAVPVAAAQASATHVAIVYSSTGATLYYHT